MARLKKLLKFFASALTVSLIILHMLLIACFVAGAITQAEMFSAMYDSTCIAIGVNLGFWAANRYLNGDA